MFHPINLFFFSFSLIKLFKDNLNERDQGILRSLNPLVDD
jgi:hypothetical protein